MVAEYEEAILTVAESIILIYPSSCQGIFNSGEII
jgi:hypothetical protein